MIAICSILPLYQCKNNLYSFSFVLLKNRYWNLLTVLLKKIIWYLRNWITVEFYICVYLNALGGITFPSLFLFMPRDEESGVYQFTPVRPFVRRMFIHIMEVTMSTGFWFSANILKITGSWTFSHFVRPFGYRYSHFFVLAA